MFFLKRCDLIHQEIHSVLHFCRVRSCRGLAMENVSFFLHTKLLFLSQSLFYCSFWGTFSFRYCQTLSLENTRNKQQNRFRLLSLQSIQCKVNFSCQQDQDLKQSPHLYLPHPPHGKYTGLIEAECAFHFFNDFKSLNATPQQSFCCSIDSTQHQQDLYVKLSPPSLF